MEMLKVPNTFTLGDWGCSESCVNSHTLEMYRRAKNSKSMDCGICKHPQRCHTSQEWSNLLASLGHTLNTQTLMKTGEQKKKKKKKKGFK